MMKDINFNLFGLNWSVRFPDKVDLEGVAEGDWADGWCYSEKQEIEVATKNKDGTKKTTKQIRNILAHELIHCIFGSGCYSSSNSDEPLVEWTAKCILSLIEQKVL